MNELFIEASRTQVRFATGKGLGTVEDLWTLPLTKLDEMATALDDEIEKTGKKSRLAAKTTASKELELKRDIIDYVITTRQAEAKAKSDNIAKKGEIDTLKDLLNRKKVSELEGLSAEEIQKKLDALEGK